MLTAGDGRKIARKAGAEVQIKRQNHERVETTLEGQLIGSYGIQSSSREKDHSYIANPIYIYGIRNPFGFAFDPGGLLVSDNGPKGHDSLTKALPGKNLGWPLVWGTVDEWYERWGAWWLGKLFRPPLWESFEQNSVPTAVQVLVDDSYGPAMAGRILMGEYGTEHVRQFAPDERIPRMGPCCMDHPEGCLIMVFFNTGDNLDAT